MYLVPTTFNILHLTQTTPASEGGRGPCSREEQKHKLLHKKGQPRMVQGVGGTRKVHVGVAAIKQTWLRNVDNVVARELPI